jgi:hypothetical protein
MIEVRKTNATELFIQEKIIKIKELWAASLF